MCLVKEFPTASMPIKGDVTSAGLESFAFKTLSKAFCAVLVVTKLFSDRTQLVCSGQSTCFVLLTTLRCAGALGRHTRRMYLPLRANAHKHTALDSST